MTTNRDRAAKVIDRLRSKGKGSYLIAAGLDAAGLLAPDLPDEWVDAKKLREVIDKLREDGHYVSENLADELEAILPTPPSPRTLADMAPVERAECEWMQCDHPALEEPGVILQIWGNGCRVLSREGVVEAEALNHVTPRPDLPRMQWPGNEPEEAHVDSPESASPKPTIGLLGRWARHPKHGDVLVINDKADLDGMVAVAFRDAKWARGARANTVPFDELTFPGQATRPEEVPPGEPWLLEVDGREAIGFRNDPETALCWMVMFRDDDDHDYSFDSDVTLVARLVPETTEQDDEPVFDPACTYRDREGDKWLSVEGAWRWANSSSGPIKGNYRTPPAKYGPYTRIEA